MFELMMQENTASQAIITPKTKGISLNHLRLIIQSFNKTIV
jgi:hypothetical protein